MSRTKCYCPEGSRVICDVCIDKNAAKKKIKPVADKPKTLEEMAEAHRLSVIDYDPDAPGAIVHGDDEAILANFNAGAAALAELSKAKAVSYQTSGKGRPGVHSVSYVDAVPVTEIEKILRGENGK